LIHGDCLQVLPTLEAASFDAVVTDPPYGQTNESYDRGVDPYVWKECFRVCKPNAALISFAGSPTYHRIASGVEAAGWRIRQMWAWVYRNGFMTSAYPLEGFDRLAPAMDPICFATKGKVLLRVSREGDRPWFRKRKEGEVCSWSDRSGRRAPTAVGRWPRTVVSDGCEPFDYFILNPNSPSLRHDKVGHPNQKPLALMRWLLGKLPVGHVLDPFMGSGSTQLACIQEGFEFTGIDQDAAYIEMARARVRDKLPLFAPEAGLCP
jgi:site-specific DNA-methyltransferase (adenine-specific)